MVKQRAPITRSSRGPRGPRGFTLIEMMITVAILGIIAAIALPSYQSSVRKGRRSEAFKAMSEVQLAQERWRSGHTTYSNDLSSSGLNLSTTTAPGGHYGLALSGVSGTGYTVTATANGGQADDAACKTMAVELTDGNLKHGSSSTTSIDWADAGRCWTK